MKRATRKRMQALTRRSNALHDRLKEGQDGYNRKLLVLAILTFLASAGATFFMGIQSWLMKTTLIASQRAWMSPYDVNVEGEFSTTGTSFFVVKYRNTGHEPATKVRRSISLLPVAGAASIIDINHCQIAVEKSDTEITAYPSDTINYQVTVRNDGTGANYEIISGEKTLQMRGCFIYETMGTVRQSEFCFYWTYQQGMPLKDWKWHFCPTGNLAT